VDRGGDEVTTNHAQRPVRLNALNLEMVSEPAHVLDEARQDRACRVVVTGAGRLSLLGSISLAMATTKRSSVTESCDIGALWILPRVIGAGRADELMLTGRRFDADDALDNGLLAKLVEPEELMLSLGKPRAA
jgi:enoyl-CoA hydratase/carnithine racemase